MALSIELFQVQPVTAPIFEGWPDEVAVMYAAYNAALPGGWGYKILADDVPCIVQDCDPEGSGWVPMTQERAQARAEQVIAGMQAPAE